jgi:hypothetical protein
MASPINWTDLWPASRAGLWDGDIIAFKSIPDATLGNSTEIELISANNISWWKAVVLFNAAGAPIVGTNAAGVPMGTDVDTFNDQHDKVLRFTAAKTGSASRLELLKAKALGFHTGMYSLDNLAGTLRPGTRAVFTWLQDRSPFRDAYIPIISFRGVQSFNSQTQTMSVTARSVFTADIRVINRCNIDWDPNPDFDLRFALGSQNARDNTMWGTNRIPIRVNVGESMPVVLTAQFRAPNQNGVFPFSWQMVQDGAGGGWFGDTINITASVSGAIVKSRPRLPRP